MAHETDIFEINGIFIHRLLPEYIDEALSRFAPESIQSYSYRHTEVIKGLFMYFNTFEQAKTAVRRPKMYIQGRSFMIYLAKTSLTVHGIATYTPDIKTILESNKFTDILSYHKVYNFKKCDDSILTDYRVILDFPEYYANFEFSPIQWHGQLFEITFFCQLCQENGHKALNCPFKMSSSGKSAAHSERVPHRCCVSVKHDDTEHHSNLSACNSHPLEAKSNLRMKDSIIEKTNALQHPSSSENNGSQSNSSSNSQTLRPGPSPRKENNIFIKATALQHPASSESDGSQSHYSSYDSQTLKPGPSPRKENNILKKASDQSTNTPERQTGKKRASDGITNMAEKQAKKKCVSDRTENMCQERIDMRQDKNRSNIPGNSKKEPKSSRNNLRQRKEKKRISNKIQTAIKRAYETYGGVLPTESLIQFLTEIFKLKTEKKMGKAIQITKDNIPGLINQLQSVINRCEKMKNKGEKERNNIKYIKDVVKKFKEQLNLRQYDLNSF